MDWKHVTLYCPHCEFPHGFKRQTWWELEGGVIIGLYSENDMKARKSCKQELIYGEATYEALQANLAKIEE